MTRRVFAATFLAALLGMLAAAPTLAGGWAQASIDPATTPGDDDTPTIVVFGLLQHGVTPVDFGSATVSAFDPASGETVEADARPLRNGRWSAELRLRPGATWRLTIQHTQLQVAAAADMTLTTGPALGASAVSGAAANVGLLAVLIGAAFVPLLVGGSLLLALWRRPPANRHDVATQPR
jgi:hypothetical protein